MSITRCPHCGARQLIEPPVIGQVIACIRCEQTFRAAVHTAAGHALEMFFAGAALLVGLIVSWLMIRTH